MPCLSVQYTVTSRSVIFHAVRCRRRQLELKNVTCRFLIQMISFQLLLCQSSCSLHIMFRLNNSRFCRFQYISRLSCLKCGLHSSRIDPTQSCDSSLVGPSTTLFEGSLLLITEPRCIGSFIISFQIQQTGHHIFVGIVSSGAGRFTDLLD